MLFQREGWRYWVPVALLCAFAGYVSWKLVLAHVDPEVSGVRRIGERELPARRGGIYDCTREPYPLVRSVPVWEYSLDPVALTNRLVRPKGEKKPRTREAIVGTIASALRLPYAEVLKMADAKPRAGWRSQFLAVSSDARANRVLGDSRLVSGVAIQDRHERQYLRGRHLSHVLGSLNAEDVGSAGIEQMFNSTLSGINGRVRGYRDARGHEIYDRRIIAIPAVPGADVYLTIDHNIQYEVESALADGIAEFGAGSGWSIVLDARTGAVLAMASLPDFDPKSYGTTTDAQKINRAVAFNYEPGSVMKVITAAAGIDLGIVRPTTTYSTNRDDDRYYRLPGDGSHKWEPRMTVKDAVVHSSNIVIGKLGFDLGPERLWTYMRAFGFGQKTGIELPGEQYGILPNWKKWDKVKWSRAPIGQGVSVTAVQLASAYQAIANDGVRIRPWIVSRVVGPNGETVREHAKDPGVRVIRAETARELREMMLGVASNEGTARRAAIKGYSVAGKTGTAQKVIDGRYSDSLFRATFCGIVPASAPRFVVLVTLDFDAKTKFHQGGNSAGPVFRRIATAALRYEMVPPDCPDDMFDGDDEDAYDRVMSEREKKFAPNR